MKITYNSEEKLLISPIFKARRFSTTHYYSGFDKQDDVTVFVELVVGSQFVAVIDDTIAIYQKQGRVAPLIQDSTNQKG